MYKLLIVEDEKWEREGLIDFLDWNTLGIELPEVACDGIEGLEKARELQPDIIITDIKMPGMDGLKMSRSIREFLPAVKIVILTGYDDFKLAKDAISISANDYILKPVEEAELLEAIKKVLGECDRQAKREEEQKALMELLDENRVVVQRDLLNGILKERASLEAQQQIRQLGILPAYGKYTVLSAGFGPAPTGTQYNMEEWLELAGGEILSQCNCEGQTGITFLAHPTDDILFLVASGGMMTEDSLETFAGAFVDECETLGYRICLGIGTVVDSMDRLFLSCQQSREALSYGLFWGDMRIAGYGRVESLQQDQAGKIGEFLVKGNYYTRQLMHSLRAAEEDRMKTLLEEMFQAVDAGRWANRSMIVNFFYGLLNETSLLFYSTNLADLEEGTAGAMLLDMPDFRSIRGFVGSFFEKAMGVIQDKKNNKDEYIVKKVEQIVRERYHSDISIKTIAAEIYLSPNYLGSLFRKCTSVAFNDYLCQYRMEKAKELLQSSNHKVSKVAQEVGYPNTSYFCQVFKELFGIAPGEYQEMYRKG